MKKIYLSILAIGALSLGGNQALAQRNCGVMEHHEMLLQQDPNYGENLQRIEDFTNNFIAQGGQLTDRAVINIPVVVHVVYNTTAENISDAQIMSQINILNADFRKLNADASLIPSAFAGVAADAEIQFCLASVDPNGNATNGIVRKSTTKTSFTTNDYVKYSSQGGSDAWPAGSYLNLWVCDLGTSLLGYAQFPGGAAATDGVVCAYTAFGNTGTATAPFNKGRTATHEVGHWLNLRHIWGDATCGTDQVSDTPTHNTANYGCPTYPHLSTCTGTPTEMTMNYMDYTDDACMYMFTAGQKARMGALFASGGARISLLSSNGCGTANPGTCGTPSGLATASITTSSASLSWTAVSGATAYTVQYRTVGSTTWSTGTVTSNAASLTGLTAGTNYEWGVSATCASGSSSFSSSATFTTLSTTTCTNDTYETNETLATAKSLTVNTTYSAMKLCSGDVDWFKFTSSSSQKKVRVRIYNLPADYDVQLYNSAGTLLGTGQNSGTTNDGVYYNSGGSNATYYVKVYGYSGASSNTAYTIRCERSNTNYTSTGRMDGEEELADADMALTFTAFPNPTSDIVNLMVNGGSSDLISVNVYDMNGRLVHTQTSAYGSDGVTVHYDMSGLKAGLYLVEVNDGTTRTTQRIMRN
jgi:hypothetical protein